FFQFTPHDLHDWDSTQIPILLETQFRGENRKALAWANRNGFYYLLDRTSGTFLTAKAFVKQTWAKGFDEGGRPELIPGNEPTPEGNDRVWPGTDGGANWMSHSYSPLTRLLYVFAREEHRLFSKNAVPHPTTEVTANETLAPTTMAQADRKSTRLNSSHVSISYAVFC